MPADAPLPAAPPLAPLAPMTLARGRVHEICGPARHALAALVAGAAQPEGPVLWLRPGWRVEHLGAQGLARLMPDPGALIVVPCKAPVDVLWCMEEALRSGAVALVVAELADPPDLRQLRRLHLAAGDGLMRNRQAGRTLPAPLGLVLAAESADSRITGVESRWALHPLAPTAQPEGGLTSPALRASGRWRLARLLMRGLPPQDWEVQGTAPPSALQDRAPHIAAPEIPEPAARIFVPQLSSGG